MWDILEDPPRESACRLGAIIDGLPIVDEPDSVGFLGRIPRCVFELKSSRYPREPYLDEKV